MGGSVSDESLRAGETRMREAARSIEEILHRLEMMMTRLSDAADRESENLAKRKETGAAKEEDEQKEAQTEEPFHEDPDEAGLPEEMEKDDADGTMFLESADPGEFSFDDVGECFLDRGCEALADLTWQMKEDREELLEALEVLEGKTGLLRASQALTVQERIEGIREALEGVTGPERAGYEAVLACAEKVSAVTEDFLSSARDALTGAKEGSERLTDVIRRCQEGAERPGPGMDQAEALLEARSFQEAGPPAILKGAAEGVLLTAREALGIKEEKTAGEKAPEEKAFPEREEKHLRYRDGFGGFLGASLVRVTAMTGNPVATAVAAAAVAVTKMVGYAVKAHDLQEIRAR